MLMLGKEDRCDEWVGSGPAVETGGLQDGRCCLWVCLRSTENELRKIVGCERLEHKDQNNPQNRLRKAIPRKSRAENDPHLPSCNRRTSVGGQANPTNHIYHLYKTSPSKPKEHGTSAHLGPRRLGHQAARANHAKQEQAH